jgi:DNA topoisomerase VI subunit B
MNRRHFVASRDLDFFTLENLAKQIGHAQKNWAIALVKELIDNGLDACESAGARPDIHLVADEDVLSVQDNGPGLPDAVIEKALDYSVRVSDKAAYVSPSRGQQGNALKTLFAAPCVLGGGHGTVIIDSMSSHRTIQVCIDPIDQIPRVHLDVFTVYR